LRKEFNRINKGSPGDIKQALAEEVQDSEREVKEFRFKKKRLEPIDYKNIIALGLDWVDPQFPPKEGSILDKTIMRPERLRNWETFIWKRPSEVYGEGNFCLYSKIDPGDIKQGYCGDCYFLSSISSLAEFPERVEDIFLTKQVNDAGCYALRLYVNGEEQIVVVDDYFPYCAYKDEWAFSRSGSDKEIWVLLLEKAWAKLYGSY
jgi:calpain-15